MQGPDARRASFLKRLNSSHLRSSDVRRYVELPADLQGHRILDIGAGTSTTSMDLARDGAAVVALDLRFRNVEEIRQSSASYFRMYRSSLDEPALKQRSPMLACIYEGDEEDRRRFFDDFARSARGLYVAGDLWKLPFADDTFDVVYSIRCLSDCYADPDIFIEAVGEALRVAKPGSMLQVSPWQDDYLSLIRGLPVGASVRQQHRVLLLLGTAGFKYQVRTVTNSNVQCLWLFKTVCGGGE